MLSVATEIRFEPPKRLVAYWFYRTLRACRVSLKAKANVFFVSTRRLRDLYRQYGGVNKATTVLSFPWTENRVPGQATNFLGEIFICPAVIAKEFGRGRAFERGLRQIMVHATLHLLGYDHGAIADQRVMEKVEAKIFKTS